MRKCDIYGKGNICSTEQQKQLNFILKLDEQCLITHVAPKQVEEEDEKEMDYYNHPVSSHHQFAIVYFDRKHLYQLQFLQFPTHISDSQNIQSNSLANQKTLILQFKPT